MQIKTYNKTIELPKLTIGRDELAESPREWDNLGYFITVDRNYSSPDGIKNPQIQSIVERTGQDANNQEEHMQLIKDAITSLCEEVMYITPVVKYEHGIVRYSRGAVHNFDYSNNGFYIVTDKTQKVVGIPVELFEKAIDSELETYTNYVNGDVYYFTLYDDNGEIIESVGGFYDLEDMKDCLPSEYKDDDLTEYIK